MASRVLAATYGQMPDAFDDWPVARVERELEIYNAIATEGGWLVTAADVARMLGVGGG